MQGEVDTPEVVKQEMAKRYEVIAEDWEKTDRVKLIEKKMRYAARQKRVEESRKRQAQEEKKE